MAQSTRSVIVARIVADLEGVANIGNVHNRLRLATNEEEILAVGKARIGDADVLRMWTVHLERTDSTWAEAGGTYQWNRRILIEGFLQIEDATDSEGPADALTEAVLRAVNNDLRDTKLNNTVLGGGPAFLDANEPRVFGFVLAHYIRIVCPVWTIETP